MFINLIKVVFIFQKIKCYYVIPTLISIKLDCIFDIFVDFIVMTKYLLGLMKFIVKLYMFM